MLELYGHPFSSYTWKALIPLYANGTAFSFRMLDGAHGSNGQYIAGAHPAGKFPVLADGDATVVEASAIIEHLAVHHPGPAPLIPADPAAAAVTRMLDRVFDNYVMANMQAVVGAFLADPDEPDIATVATGKVGLMRAFHWLEAWLSKNEFGPHVSLASCAAAPALFYADWVERIPGDCPRMQALRAELLSLPAVARCVEEARPYREYFPLGAPDRD